jgi:DNA integrity scanning protein DisA with diadenylate cyclase activity
MMKENNLASKFKKKQLNDTFLEASFLIAKEIKPEFLIIASNSLFDEARLEDIHGNPSKVILIHNDATSYVEAIKTKPGFEVCHFRRKSKPEDDFLKELLFVLLEENLLHAEATALVVSGHKDDWDRLSQIRFVELERILGQEQIKSLTQLSDIAPLDVIEKVIEMALEIGLEGREGKPVGTILVLGDHKKVLTDSRPLVFNPFKGYPAREREIFRAEVRDSIKEVAKIDGAIIISSDGIVHAGGIYLDFSAREVDIPAGLGSRHTAAAAVTCHTKSIAIAISESTGVVRIFRNGSIFKQIAARNSP